MELDHGSESARLMAREVIKAFRKVVNKRGPAHWKIWELDLIDAANQFLPPEERLVVKSWRTHDYLGNPKIPQSSEAWGPQDDPK